MGLFEYRTPQTACWSPDVYPSMQGTRRPSARQRFDMPRASSARLHLCGSPASAPRCCALQHCERVISARVPRSLTDGASYSSLVPRFISTLHPPKPHRGLNQRLYNSPTTPNRLHKLPTLDQPALCT